MRSYYVPITPLEVSIKLIDPRFGYRLTGARPIILRVPEYQLDMLMIDTLRDVEMWCYQHTFFFPPTALYDDEYRARLELDDFIELEIVS